MNDEQKLLRRSAENLLKKIYIFLIESRGCLQCDDLLDQLKRVYIVSVCATHSWGSKSAEVMGHKSVQRQIQPWGKKSMFCSRDQNENDLKTQG